MKLGDFLEHTLFSVLTGIIGFLLPTSFAKVSAENQQLQVIPNYCFYSFFVAITVYWAIVLISPILSKREEEKRIRYIKEYLPKSGEKLYYNRKSFLEGSFRFVSEPYKICEKVSLYYEDDGDSSRFSFFFNSLEDGRIYLLFRKGEIKLSKSMEIVVKKASIKEIFSKIDDEIMIYLEKMEAHELAIKQDKEWNTQKEAEKAIELLGL